MSIYLYYFFHIHHMIYVLSPGWFPIRKLQSCQFLSLSQGAGPKRVQTVDENIYFGQGNPVTEGWYFLEVFPESGWIAI